MSVLVRTLRGMVTDALNHASDVAMRAQEATEGAEATMAFDEVRRAIHDFKANHPAMIALNAAVASSFLRKAEIK
jgi:hypothetical protein